MRKIALIAMLAIVGAMIPMTTASSQQSSVGTETDGVGTIVLANASGGVRDVFIDQNGTEFVKVLDDFLAGDEKELQVPVGTRTIVVCTQFAPENGCTGGTQLSTRSFNMGENDQQTGYIISSGAPNTVVIFNEDTSHTEIDHLTVTVHNSDVPNPITVCVDGTAIGPLNVGQTASLEDVKSGLGVPFFTYVGIVPATCGQAGFVNDASDPTIDLAPGTNLVIGFAQTVFVGGVCDCSHQIFVGEEKVDGKGSPEFCEALLGAQGIRPILDATFSEVEVGKLSTYPGPDTVQDALEKIGEILERGNETAPPDIRDAWYTVTGNFGRLVAELTAVGYDLKDFKQSSLRDLIEGIDTSPVDDEDAIAATDALSAWYPVNCAGAIETEPSFTG